MKVVAFNGSPNKNGNTYEAIKVVAAELEKENIEVEIIHVGNKVIRGCLACGGCSRNMNEKCVIQNDQVNEWIQKMKEADGIILGSPVHYSAIAGTMKSFLDRAFLVTSVNNGMLRHKVGASVVAVRRSGGVSTFSQLNNYINYSEMVMPTSNYWNVGYGTAPGEVAQDEEGNQIMRVLGKNMAWLMKVVDFGKDHVEESKKEDKIFMNFIR
ncbi:iron-sulfur flavoprotein [Clostridium pasteurianum DSM 525 = ATCC 6013]|uniref:Iron-sulfur flavoprotein n=1 Tax=Clostridium pasteurianum DSM 525 = ATCC 6013 TaxID=1262449 RepID=A0A0H3JBC4_CLOPA|nr:flavodoxin family protein [Clostridium pasteurianum]AJA49485.1 iron-sulfur flavoprotein [Clostridium pasteurianum DSM 525 = ATCC 6013]AJA53473.1 iron-sulfur flavoprotein [Clostridium pasteurianum DSM 525 = ATCC 6013]AOZ76649.1 FMN reductase [Clostridium pasteurianum DSM 525 = ATCC 6013]AOZ80446.1 FMN reductase [Clostridium pasteurianum]ELP58400.1 NADPH-dependent FMN reductase [Clostridium pasteurianum DSM 525 = ATCC 6013]